MSPVSYERVGRELGPKEFKDLKLVIERDRFSFQRRDVVIRGTFKIEPTKKLETIDPTYDSEAGEAKVVAVFGIYELEGDALKLCLAKKRPTEFETAPEATSTLVTYKRQKP